MNERTTQCDNFRIGREFLQKHNWPMKLMQSKNDRCYCLNCYPDEYKNTVVTGGNTYVIPRSWTRFGVYVDVAFFDNNDVWNTWANCFHGTRIEFAKSIVEHRQLLLPEDTTLEGKELHIRPNHIPGEVFFFTTPTIKYAALPMYAETYDFTSPTDQEKYKITVALQCKQKPGSFIVQGQTVGYDPMPRICPNIPNDKMEWKSKNRMSILPYGVLLLIEGKNGGKKSKVAKVIRQVHAEVDENEVGETDSGKPGKKGRKIKCPRCSGLNAWNSSADHQAISVSCIHKYCKRTFQHFNCPHCSSSNFWRHAIDEEEVVTCRLKKCNKKFQLVNCPHCRSLNICENAFYKVGRDSNIICAYVNCKKAFQQPLRSRTAPKLG